MSLQNRKKKPAGGWCSQQLGACSYHWPGGPNPSRRLRRRLLSPALFLLLPIALQAEPGGQGPTGFPPMQRASGGLSWVDTHCHLDGRMKKIVDYEGAAQAAVEAMDQVGIRKCLVMPPPMPPNFPNLYDCDLFAKALEKFPGRFAFLGGGGSLNSLIHSTPHPAKVTEALRAQFEKKAESILAQGAVGFGEMTALHLSHFATHPFESVSPDHPLFLLLADIAARHEVVIDFHMDAVVQDVALPEGFSSPPNSKTLSANVAAFERLLEHNPKARIVWAHLGSDFIGDWTLGLTRSLLEKHPNLYMSVRLISPPGLVEENWPLTPNRSVKAEWMEVFKAFPDRFLLGSDTFYASPKIQLPWKRPPAMMSLMPLRMLLNRMPADLARKIAYQNAARLYRLQD
ncbi:MAG: amidohydrolase family protein [Planctomycetes bacterium]|nr:amidohydrolase family protein [Planctomycetota bacterium]